MQSELTRFEDENFETESKRAIDEPKQILESRFSKLALCDRPVRVIKKASDTDINTLHDALSSLDPTYNQDIKENSRFANQMLILHQFCAEHAVFTPYSLRFQKCEKTTFKNRDCSQIRSLPGEKDLVFQYQPTPQPDKQRLGH